MTKPKVLIVEDEVLVSQDLATELSAAGYSIVGEARSGKEAIRIAAETHPDLVLMDIRLRGDMDGIDAATLLKLQGNPAIVYLTAYEADDLLQRAKATDPYGYLSKPISATELRQTVEMALYKHGVDQRLRESEERYRILVENSFDGIFIQKGSSILFANSRLHEMLGYREGELAGKDHWTIYHPEDQATARQRAKARMSGEKITSQYEIRLQRKDGTSFEGEVRAKVLTLDSEPGIQVWVRDVSDLKQTERGLQLERERFQNLAENSPFAMMLIGENGTFQYVNPRFKELFGYDLEDVPTGRDWFRKAYPDSDYRHQVISTWTRDLANSGGGRIRDRVFKVTCRDGTASMIHFRPVKLRSGDLFVTCEDITERALAEKALRDSEEKYRHLAELLPEFVFEVDKRGSLTFLNNAGLSLLGYPPEEIVTKKTILDVLISADHERAIEEFEAVKRGEIIKGAEYTVLTRDGATVPIIGYLAPIYSGETFLGVRGIAVDIAEQKRLQQALAEAKDQLELRVHERTAELARTNERLRSEIGERKQAEGALRESEHKYRMVVDNAAELIFVGQGDKLVFANAEAIRRSGYSPEEFQARSYLEFIHPDDQAMVAERYRRRLRGEDVPSSYAMRVMDREGNTWWAYFNMVMITWEGRPAVLSFGTDINDLKQTEEALRGSEAKYRFLAEQMHDVVLTMDLNMNTTYASPSIEKVLGYSPEEAMAKTFSEQLAAESLELVTRTLQEELERDGEDGVPQDRSMTLELDFYRKNGSMACLESVLSFIRDEDSKPIGVYALSRDITDRKQAEEALRESEERYRTIVENIEDTYFEADLKGNLVFFNDATCRILGYPRDELVGMNYRKYADEEQAQTVFEVFNSVYRTGEPGILNRWQIIRKDGECRTVETPVFLMRDVQGEPCGFRGLGRDVTERIRAEAAIRESEARYRAIVDNAQDCIFLKNGGLQYTHVNPAMERLFGVAAHELIGRTDAELFGSKAGQHIKEVDLRVLDGETVDQEDTKPVKGNPRTFHVVKAPIIDSSGAISGLCGIARDITDRKQAEIALQESEAKYKTIIENVEEGYYEVDLSGNMTFFNDSMCKMLGLTREELLGMNNREYMDEATSKKVFEIFNAVYRTGNHATVPTWPLVRKDGAQRMVDTSISLIRDSQGEVAGFRGIVRDVTERERIQMQSVQAQKMQAIGTLAGGIAHDFNNILYAIIGYTELSLDEVSEGTVLRANLEAVLDSGQRAKDLVNQILTFSRQSQQERRLVNVVPIVKEGIRFLRASLPSTIEIRQKIEPELRPVIADPTEIHQILMNLCTNAGHAMRGTGGVLELNVENVRVDESAPSPDPETVSGSYLRISVSDTGTGMAPETIQRVFEPYFTTKEKGEGTGLGLAVVHGIVSSYGGSIKVHSDLGHGSTFQVYLPGVEAKPRQEAITTKTPPTGSETILFVDDEPTVAEMAKQILERLGYKVISRTSSLEALELFRAKCKDIDLIITDMTMPNLTGLEFAREIRKIRPKIPLILCTGFSELITEDRVESLRINDVVMKPLLKKDMAEAIRRVLGQSTETEA